MDIRNIPGFYINMDNRVDRNNYMQKFIADSGLKLYRLSGVSHKNSLVGCGLSHIKCLELAKKHNFPYLLICEDDICFTSDKAILNINNLLNELAQKNIHWDVIALEYYNETLKDMGLQYGKRAIDFFDTGAYIVHQDYYDTLLNFYRSRCYMIEKYNTCHLSIDANNRMKQIDMWIVPNERPIIQMVNVFNSDLANHRKNLTRKF